MNKKLFLISPCIALACLLLPLAYICSIRYSYYMEVVDFKEKYEGKIVKYQQPKRDSLKVSLSLADIESLTLKPADIEKQSLESAPAVTGVKDGDVVWVSGTMEGQDTIMVTIWDASGNHETLMPFVCLNARYIEIEETGGKREKYPAIIYEDNYAVKNAKIGAMPIDAEPLKSVEKEMCIYEDWQGSYGVKVFTTSGTAISCIGRYKDGKLMLTDEGGPFLYALQEDVEPEDIINAEMERRMAIIYCGGIPIYAIIVLVAFLAIVAILYFTIKEDEKNLPIDADPIIIKEMSRLSRKRYVILIVPLVISLGVLYYMCTKLRGSYMHEFEMNLVFMPVIICLIPYTLIVTVLEKIFVVNHYKDEILGRVLSQNDDVLLAFAPLNPDTLCKLGVTSAPYELYDPAVKFRCEDSYVLTVDNGERKTKLNFFEASATRRVGKEVDTLFDALCIVIPVDADENVRFNIEPMDHIENSGLKLRYKNAIRNEAFPEGMKLFTNLSPETDEFLNNTPFLENVQMIKDVLRERLYESYLVFSVCDGSMYVFVYTSLNRFEISLYDSITYEDVKYDIDTVDAFREIGRRWKS